MSTSEGVCITSKYGGQSGREHHHRDEGDVARLHLHVLYLVTAQRSGMAMRASFANQRRARDISRFGRFAWLLNPAGARPPQYAGARVELRGLSILDRTFTATQDELVVGGGGDVVAEHTGRRDGGRIIAAGDELQRARARERLGRADAIVVALREQDAHLVARPPGSLLTRKVLQEIQ